MATQQRFTWFRQNWNSFTYKINRTIFKQLQGEETTELRQLREQFLGNSIPELLNIMFNPMLSAGNPLEDSPLHENYALWNRAEFPMAIEKLVAHLGKRFPRCNCCHSNPRSAGAQRKARYTMLKSC